MRLNKEKEENEIINQLGNNLLKMHGTFNYKIQAI